MADWNPTLYLKFEKERNQPIIDLLARLDGVSPKSILDVGCGPGNSTRLLSKRWPSATVVGMDNSQAMLEKAEADDPRKCWVLRDAAQDLSDLGSFDLIFSNAAFQWMPNHDTLLPNLFACLEQGGVMAAQVPNNSNSPIFTAIEDVLSIPEWQSRFQNMPPGVTYQGPEAYYDRLCRLDDNPVIWETQYCHIMDSAMDMVKWLCGAFLRRHFEVLANDKTEQHKFEVQMEKSLASRIPQRINGKFLFPFRRVFFTVTKK